MARAVTATECLRELGRCVEPARRFTGQSRADNVLYRGRHVRWHRAEIGDRSDEFLRKDSLRAGAPVRRPPGEHLKENAAETVDVGTRVDLAVS